ncbi:MAG: hypothetical protein IPP61_05935 [Cytophagaceae bacterium]|nr:hypothetical protein [Cytophagaceae bacterium]MBL0301879.1 hypothetical protein [Cytophagaceae bacterium]MBL0324706.1 hypothetical protein [Cytophagaceae bacterium]
MKNQLIAFTLFFFIASYSSGQISYRTRYKKALTVEVFGVSPIASINYEKAFNRKMKSFNTFRVGAGLVPGSMSWIGLKDGGLSLPIAVTQNVNLNNLKKRVKHRVSLRCKATPSKVSVEWFGEFGLSYTPVLYANEVPRNYIFGIVGLRQQIVIDIPPKPKVIFLKIQYTPKYYQKHFSYFIDSHTSSIAGISLGFSI